MHLFLACQAVLHQQLHFGPCFQLCNFPSCEDLSSAVRFTHCGEPFCNLHLVTCTLIISIGGLVVEDISSSGLGGKAVAINNFVID